MKAFTEFAYIKDSKIINIGCYSVLDAGYTLANFIKYFNLYNSTHQPFPYQIGYLIYNKNFKDVETDGNKTFIKEIDYSGSTIKIITDEEKIIKMNDIKEVYSDIIPSRDIFLICIKSKDRKKFRHLKLFLHFDNDIEYDISDYTQYETIEETDADIYAHKRKKPQMNNKKSETVEHKTFPFYSDEYKPKHIIAISPMGSLCKRIMNDSELFTISARTIIDAIWTPKDFDYRPLFDFIKSETYTPNYTFQPFKNIQAIFREVSPEKLFSNQLKYDSIITKSAAGTFSPHLTIEAQIKELSGDDPPAKSSEMFATEKLDHNIHKDYNRININKRKKKDKYNHG